MNQPLTYMDGETLMNTVLPPIHFVISQLLPQGLHVLAGAPKVGKSWLSLWLCLQVAKGEPAWEFPTTQGNVLYLCLEDSYVRMTKILRSRGVLNPQAYFNQNNPDFYKNSDYWRKPYDWHATSIRVILNNPVYLGKLVYGRSKTKATVYKGLQAV